MSKAYEVTKAWRLRHPDIRAYRAEEARKWRLAHPDLHSAIKKRYRERHLEERRIIEAEQARQSRLLHPERHMEVMKRQALKRHRKYEELAGRARPDVCDICGELHIRIVFDHCHDSGEFRGWLCDRCNRTLGTVKDSPELLLKMVRYLKQ